jgi:hypothetical protein
MTINEYLQLMEFPKEWIEWEMLPDELRKLMLSSYEPGHENGAEHDRNGAFHWWLKKSPPPTREELIKLGELSYLDPDELMAADVRRYIKKSLNCDSSVDQCISRGEARHPLTKLSH